MLIVEEKKDQSVTVKLENKKELIFLPQTDLNKSLDLLRAFNNISNKKNKKIFSIWKTNGVYIYPALQEWLFWNFFVGLVQNKKLSNYLNDKKFKIKNNKYYTFSSFKRMQKVLNYKRPLIIKLIYNVITFLLTRPHSFKNKIILNDEGPFSFRFTKLKNILKKKNNFLKLEKVVLGSLFTFKSLTSKVFFGYLPLKTKKISHSFDLEKCNCLSEYLSDRDLGELIESINSKCMEIEYQIKQYLPILKKNKPKVLLTYDQIENALPIVACLKILKVKVFSFQHGPFSKYHAGWLAPDIPSSYCNLKSSKLVVWGTYWKSFLCKYSNKYNSDNIIVGPHLNKEIKYDWDKIKFRKKTKEFNKLKILVPYEFLANNSEISDYISEFHRLGWRTVVKLRPEKNIDKVTDKSSYKSEIRSMIDFREEISDDELVTFDAVVCTQSVFAVEMMRFNVPIWYLETSVPFLKHIAENGIAHLVNMSVINDFFENTENVQNYLEPSYDINDYKNLFNDMDLEKFINSLEELNG
tara:strand:- start:2566 stop:4137 length:1572 start_codon:yes stop_codon:yes gene_type:complete